MSGSIDPHRPDHHPRSDRGFALIAVLWVLVGISALALAGTLAARDAVHAAQNRAELARARWMAEGCVESARAAAAAALDAARDEGPSAPTWSALDRAIARSPLVDGCDLSVIPAGRALDVNAATGDDLRRLFIALGALPASADSLADAVLDWRDADGEARADGAEAAEYRAAERELPRNAPFVDVRELARVRGLDRFPGIDTLLSAEPGAVVLTRAPAAVLAALPGMTPEAVARLLQARAQASPNWSLALLADELSPPARAELMRAYQDLYTRTTTVPEAWIVTARARSGTPPVAATVEVRLAHAGPRAALVRRKDWVE